MQTLDTGVLCIRRVTSHGGATDDSVSPGLARLEERPYEDVFFVFSRQLAASWVKPQRDGRWSLSVCSASDFFSLPCRM